MLVMAKKSREESADDMRQFQAKFHGLIAACVRLEGRMNGLSADAEMLRFVLTRRYKEMGWLQETPTGLVIGRPGAAGEEE